MTTTLILSVLLCLFRYSHLAVNLIAYHLFYKPTAIPSTTRDDDPSNNITIVLPTIFSNTAQSQNHLLETLSTIERNNPFKILVAVPKDKAAFLLEVLEEAEMDWVHLEIVKIDGTWNRWRGTAKALTKVETAFVVFLPEEAVGIPSSSRFLAGLAAPFQNDEEVGVVSAVEKVTKEGGFWNFFRDVVVEERTRESVAVNTIYGGISELPSCTAAFRTEIVKTREFVSLFMNDEVAEVDTGYFLARWTFEAGYKVKIQRSEETTVESIATAKDWKACVQQSLKEARAKWRAVFVVTKGEEKNWYKKRHYTLYAIYNSAFQTPSLLLDALMTFLYSNFPSTSTSTKAVFYFLLIASLARILQLLCRHPRDLKYLPLSILFAYLHGFLDIYAAVTMDRSLGDMWRGWMDCVGGTLGGWKIWAKKRLGMRRGRRGERRLLVRGDEEELDEFVGRRLGRRYV